MHANKKEGDEAYIRRYQRLQQAVTSFSSHFRPFPFISGRYFPPARLCVILPARSDEIGFGKIGPYSLGCRPCAPLALPARRSKGAQDAPQEVPRTPRAKDERNMAEKIIEKFERSQKPDKPEKPVEKPAPKPKSSASGKSTRLVSLDAYRGFIMLALAAGGLGLSQVAKQTLNPAADPNAFHFWSAVAHEFSHVEWPKADANWWGLINCTFWDLIQPSFMFMVGVAMPYSYAVRRDRGDSFLRMLFHAATRSFVLVVLGVFLASNSHHETNFLFTNVLAQIGLGYTFVFLLVGRSPILQVVAILAILGGYGYAFYACPLPPPDANYAAVGMSADRMLPGVMAHWSENVNWAGEVDRWFLNLLPRSEVYMFTKGGYQTLNFIPSIATMLLGLMAGELLRSGKTPKAKLLWLSLGGVGLMIAGLALGLTIIPIVKRIWTPSWVLFSGAWTLWILAAFYGLVDVRGYKRWTFPLVVVGMNSIVMYLMSQLLPGWVSHTLKVHFGPKAFEHVKWGDQVLLYGPIIERGAIMLVLWLFCWWLYRQKIFVRI
jgi:heparan-alpha-glucosaminide N-acetyltransferase